MSREREREIVCRSVLRLEPAAASSAASLADKFVNLTLAPRSHKSAESDGWS